VPKRCSTRYNSSQVNRCVPWREEDDGGRRKARLEEGELSSGAFTAWPFYLNCTLLNIVEQLPFRDVPLLSTSRVDESKSKSKSKRERERERVCVRVRVRVRAAERKSDDSARIKQVSLPGFSHSNSSSTAVLFYIIRVSLERVLNGQASFHKIA
jgi:hypothetical protein